MKYLSSCSRSLYSRRARSNLSCRQRFRRQPISLSRNSALNKHPSLAHASHRPNQVFWFSSQPVLDANVYENDKNNQENFTNKDSKKDINKRLNAAKSIPFWLDKDVSCLKQTMKALEIDFTTQSADKPASLLTEYKQLYKESIVGFSQELLSEPPPKLEPALDKLVAAGFDDLQWAKHFRKFREFNSEHQKYSADLRQKTELYKHNMSKLKMEQQKLKQMEKDASDIQDKLKDGTKESNFAGAMISVLSPLWENKEATNNDKEEKNDKAELQNDETTSSNISENNIGVMNRMRQWMKEISIDSKEENNDQAEVQNDETNSSNSNNNDVVMSRIQRNLEKQRRVVNHCQEWLNGASRKLDNLKEQRNQFQPRLTKKEFEQADRVVKEVLKEIAVAFAAYIRERHHRMIEQFRILDAKTDLTKPQEWYQHARMDRRKIIYHGGPTNSGKTYEALQRLKQAEKGLYLGPLRLLAAEVYENLTSHGVYTSLYTGQEKREVPFETHRSSTVEIAPVMEDFDVVVIDEIQMIADEFRGFAWTRALLGLRCKEIHVCGGLEAVDIVRRMAKFCGDEFELQQYERFTGLNVASKSLSNSPKAVGSYRAVEPGDCVVAFARRDIFAIKREIERYTNYKCCVIYGSLPPETRADQARLFNDPDSGFDILVASDAIGMGLNLNIKRIIFNTMFKSNGEDIVQLDHSGVKQISGRAGRRNSPFPQGEVTCRDPRDMEHLQKCMSQNIAPIERAGLLPTAEHIQQFSLALEEYELGKDHDNLHKMLLEFDDMAKTQGDFFICKQNPMRVVAQMLDDLPLSVLDKYTFCMSPASINNRYSMRTLRKFAEKYAKGEAPGLSGKLIPKKARSFEDLSLLCSMHHELELFLWCSTRFPGNAVEQQTAQALTEEVISLINKGLSESEKLKLEHDYIRRDSQLREDWERNRKKEKPSWL